MNEADEANTFRILVSTDNHLGFAEKDGIRGQDTFNTFEEILQMAQAKSVDFLFFAGDIFDESQPSIHTMHEAIRLLRKYCLGSKPVTFAMVSDPSTVLAANGFDDVNYLDTNMNVGIPIFAIHGNHDDPSGPGGLCAGDVLHAAGLVNLFGKATSVERIDVNPILLRKGSTRLAIYGVGAMREERVHRLFLNHKVTFYRPTDEPDNWFSLCAVHQNRSRHGATNYLPEHFLPTFLDLIVWGHEHECRVEPEWNSGQNFFVTQPGSSVVTALSESESQPKAVALLEVRGKEFKVTRLPLRTVRAFLFKDIVLEDELTNSKCGDADVAREVENVCVRLIEKCIEEATSKSADDENQTALTDESLDKEKLVPPNEPLIRLRIDLSGGYESFSALRFGQRFIGRVANPKDLITFNHNRDRLAAAQEKRALRSGLQEEGATDTELTVEDEKKVGLDAAEVERLVRQYLGGVEKSSDSLHSVSSSSNSILGVFTALELGRGLCRFVDNDSRDAIQTVVEGILDETIQYLRTRKCPEERIPSDVQSFCLSRAGEAGNTEDLTTSGGGFIVGQTEVELASTGKCESETAGGQPSSNPSTAIDWSSEDESQPKRTVPIRGRKRAARTTTALSVKNSIHKVQRAFKATDAFEQSMGGLDGEEENEQEEADTASLIEDPDSEPSQSKSKRARIVEWEEETAPRGRQGRTGRARNTINMDKDFVFGRRRARR
ncbi:unnamed protein product [Calicophoron daubneyi]|uniref:Double-strand break repair protein n=1 Tax=Calicophoron daubneyi TaxID=300641 RepID=A0AAV2U0N2_CALDB